MSLLQSVWKSRPALILAAFLLLLSIAAATTERAEASPGLPSRPASLVYEPPVDGSLFHRLDLAYFIRNPSAASWFTFLFAIVVAPFNIAVSGILTNLVGVLVWLYMIYRLGAALYRRGDSLLILIAGSYAYLAFLCTLGAVTESFVVTSPQFYSPIDPLVAAIGIVLAVVCMLATKYAVARWRCMEEENAARAVLPSVAIIFGIPLLARTLAQRDVGGFWVLMLRGFTGSFLLLAAFGMILDCVLLQYALDGDQRQSASLALWVNAMAATVTVTVAVFFKAFIV